MAAIACLVALWPSTPAKASDALVVYIECTGQDGARSQGSGILVSADGHVLTARHVVPDGASCQASIGNNTRQKRGIRKSFETRKIDGDFDAVLMEFGKDTGEAFPFAQVCSITDALKGKEIIAKGFHADSFGAPSATDGILSNTNIDFSGMIETTAMTVNGKSGGPVFLKDTDKIVGIIAGAQFTAQGIVSSYKMLAIDAILGDLDMISAQPNCTRMSTRPASGPRQQPPTYEPPTDSSNPAEIQSIFERAIDRFNRGSYNLALEDFTDVLRRDAQNVAALGMKAETQRQLGQLELANRNFDAALALEPDNHNLLTQRGFLHFERKIYQQATQDFDRAIQLVPGFASPYWGRGIVLEKRREYSRAFENFQEAYRLDPSPPEYKQRLEDFCSNHGLCANH